MVLTIQRMEGEGEMLPALLSYYKGTGLYKQYQAAGDWYSSYYDSENLVPQALAGVVRENCVDNGTLTHPKKENERE